MLAVGGLNILYLKRFAMFLPRHRSQAGTLCRLLASGCILAAICPSSGGANDIFAVTGVAVDATAASATEARDLALVAGQRQALTRLLRRLTLAADYGRHPRLNDSSVAALVQGIEISNEKTSSTRYLAKLRIQFKKNGIRRHLREAAIPLSETQRKPQLVLPVYEAASAVLLWDDPNPWRQAWTDREVDPDALAPLLLPAGDLADVVAISSAQAIRGDTERLGVIARRYGVADTIVAHAVLRVDLAANINRLHVTLTHFGNAEERVIIQSYRGASRDDVARLLALAVADVTLRLTEGWKRDTLVHFDQPVRLSARVPLRGLSAWVAVRRRLQESGLVREVELTALSRSGAQVVVHYLGEASQLVLDLAQRDLTLGRSEDGFWSLELSRAGAGASGVSAAR